MERQLRLGAGTLPRLVRPQALRLGINVILVGLWLWLYRPLFDYFAVIVWREDFRTNQLVLIGVLGLIGLRLRRERVRLHLDGAPHVYLPALSLVLGGSILYLLCERYLDINTLSASLFGLASYGLLGLWLSPPRWRQGLPAALLLIGVLPFGEHMQTFVGYPLRIFTASLVRDGLTAVGINSIGVDTILVFENGVSQVDLPCSGVKSLWTGMLFLLAATWLERRPLNLRWLLLALGFCFLLIVANLGRVAVLVAAGPVAGWPLLAEMLHVPLGVLGFITACAAALWLLKKEIRYWRLEIPQSPIPTGHFVSNLQSPSTLLSLSSSILHLPSSIFHLPSTLPHPPWLGPLLAAALLIMIFLYTPRPQTELAQTSPAWEFPPGLVTEPMPLKPYEIDWFSRDGAEAVERRRFEWQGLSGSMILITSTTWRAHHRPERCFEVYGLLLEDSRTHLVSPDFPVRFVSLGDGGQPRRLAASYWFQSAGRTTDDYGTRIWADLSPRRERWVLVSILFDRVPDPETERAQTLYLALHRAVAGYLSGEPQP